MSSSTGFSSNNEILPAGVKKTDGKHFGELKSPSRKEFQCLGGDLNITCLATSTLKEQQRSTAVNRIWRTHMRIIPTPFQGAARCGSPSLYVMLKHGSSIFDFCFQRCFFKISEYPTNTSKDVFSIKKYRIGASKYPTGASNAVRIRIIAFNKTTCQRIQETYVARGYKVLRNAKWSWQERRFIGILS